MSGHKPGASARVRVRVTANFARAKARADRARRRRAGGDTAPSRIPAAPPLAFPIVYGRELPSSSSSSSPSDNDDGGGGGGDDDEAKDAPAAHGREVERRAAAAWRRGVRAHGPARGARGGGMWLDARPSAWGSAVYHLHAHVRSRGEAKTLAEAARTPLPDDDHGGADLDEAPSRAKTAPAGLGGLTDERRHRLLVASALIRDSLRALDTTGHVYEAGPLRAWRLVNSSLWSWVRFLTGVMYLSLALFEPPALGGAAAPFGSTHAAELVCLAAYAADLVLTRYACSREFFWRKGRRQVRVLAVALALADVSVSLAYGGGEDAPPRYLRAVRPLFAISASPVLTKASKLIVISVGRSVKMMVLLALHLFLFSIVGFVSMHGVSDFFSTLGESHLSMFVALTTANFPDVMIPAYESSSRGGGVAVALFFVAFLSIGTVYLLSLVLALLAETYTETVRNDTVGAIRRVKRGLHMAFNVITDPPGEPITCVACTSKFDRAGRLVPPGGHLLEEAVSASPSEVELRPARASTTVPAAGAAAPEEASAAAAAPAKKRRRQRRTIDMATWSAIAQQVRPEWSATPEISVAIWYALDQDNDGKLHRKEFSSMCRFLGARRIDMTITERAVPEDGDDDGDGDGGASSSDDAVHNLFSSCSSGSDDDAEPSVSAAVSRVGGSSAAATANENALAAERRERRERRRRRAGRTERKKVSSRRRRRRAGLVAAAAACLLPARRRLRDAVTYRPRWPARMGGQQWRVPLFEAAVDAVVAVNAVLTVLVVQRDLEGLDTPEGVRVANDVFVGIYVAEAALKIGGLGWLAYWSRMTNRIDLALTIMSVVAEVALRSSGANVASLLRVARLGRLIRLYRPFGTVIAVVRETLTNSALIGLVGVLMCVMYAFAILGMELLAGRMTPDRIPPDNPYAAANYFSINCDNLGSAGLFLFVLLIVNNWHVLMAGAVAARDDDPSIRAFFIVYWVIVVLITVQLAVAILLSSFFFQYGRRHDTATRKKKTGEAVASALAEAAPAPTELVDVKVKGRSNLLVDMYGGADADQYAQVQFGD